MLSIDFIRQHPEIVRAGLERRHDSQNIDELLRRIEQRKSLATRCDGLYTSLKRLNENAPAGYALSTAETEKQIQASPKIFARWNCRSVSLRCVCSRYCWLYLICRIAATRIAQSMTGISRYADGAIPCAFSSHPNLTGN